MARLRAGVLSNEDHMQPRFCDEHRQLGDVDGFLAQDEGLQKGSDEPATDEPIGCLLYTSPSPRD